MQRLRDDHGYTLIEIMIAMALMSVGVAATLRVFASSGRTAQAAQRDNVATQKAQAAVDLMGTMPYNKLALTSAPASSADPLQPGYRVSGTTFTVSPELTETFVLSSDSGQAGAAVSPAAEAFTVGTGTSAISGHIYRYVTWRDESCPTGVCDGAQNTKRVTVAVTISGNGAVPAGTPIWVSKVVPDPQALPPGAVGTTGPTGSIVSAQDFYLYDTPCGNTTRQATSADHDTHNTAQTGADASTTSSCANPDSALQPDLMGVDQPGDPATPPPLYKLSSDLSGTYDGGLAMMRHGESCPTTYPDNATNQSATNKWSIHAWSTNTFASTFSLAGQVTLSLFTSTVGGASGAGAMCATLVDRSDSSGSPVDVSLGSFTYTLDAWPTSVRRISFTLNVSPASIAPGHRLVLTLGVKGTSDNDLYVVYDHPFYPSFLEVATPTPL